MAALDIGLVDMVVPHDQLMEEATKLANTIASKSRIALALAKSAINKGQGMSFQTGLSYEIGFFSRLVEESLINFQCKVTKIMKTVCFAFDDLDFVIHPFERAGMDGVIAVINDPVVVALQLTYKSAYRGMI